MKKFVLSIILIAISTSLHAQTVVVKDTVMTTYPYSGADPVARMGKIYPYWHFQEFTNVPVQKTWKMVVLENEYLRVKIFPEIGGKVWSIFDKKGGRELVYDNDVVKFREISLRGPWTSGGIEFNYGVIGHAPSCASPVDWSTETKPDGSVNCYIGVLEMTSRSRWTIEVNLPKDAIYCRTRSIWHNLSGEWQPYYSWANSAVETSDDLKLIFPANNAIGHSGELLTYPLNDKGIDISILGNQNYGPDKSYHMIGSHKSFFGTYYPSSDWASMHLSLRDEKLGRKYFTWAQSEQGTIWIDLLTDRRPQYIELQSGRLFNQNAIKSCTDSPYRQFLFSPYGTDEWSDYWLPCSGIGIASNVTLDAAVSVNAKGRKSEVGIYPVRKRSGNISIADKDGNVIFSGDYSLVPSEAVRIKVNGTPSVVKLDRHILWTSDDERIDRPQQRDSAFRTDESESYFLSARDNFGLRMYDESEILADSSLMLNEFNLDALNLKAALLFRKMEYAESYRLSCKALSIDQYNQDAGYIGGLAAEALGKTADAMDRFEIAALSDGAMRSACYTELAKLHFRAGDDELAREYARKALNRNSRNITAMMILTRAGESVDIAAVDPLFHFPAAEKFLHGEITSEEFASTFQEEIPWEDYLELAVFYHGLGLDRDASMILSSIESPNALISLWIAYLNGNKGDINVAEQNSIEFVFPFRRESADVLQWAVENGGGWQSRYLFALLKDHLGHKSEALELIASDSPSFAPFFAYRFTLSGDAADLRKAYSVSPDGWRYRRLLAMNLIENRQYAEAEGLLSDFYASHPDNFMVGDALLDSYIGLEKYSEAEKIIDNITYLPFEGQRGSHDKYRHIKLHRAAAECDSGNYDKALSLVDEALLWPSRLGAGRPYDDLVDTSLEEWTRAEILKRKEGKAKDSLSNLLKDTRTKDKKLF